MSASGKLLAIFDAFADRSAALTLTQIAAKSELPLSTTHRIVGELEAWGGLERGTDGRYRVGLHLWQIASRAPRGPGLRDTSLPFLQELYLATRGVVRLAVRDGTNLMFVEHLAGHGSVRLRTRTGSLLPLPSTAAGLVLLAHAPGSVREAVLAASLPRFTPHTMTDVDTILRHLSDVLCNGFAIGDRQVTDGAVAVAAPIRFGDTEPIAAVSVAVRGRGSAAVRAIVPAVCATARRLSDALQQVPLRPAV